ncbi:MAG: tRNA dihydrouridine synthase DusB [Firmicutes bacterium]|nr:tRNA dihydrouridine synthase DusB [Bacillota bacterium]
MKTPIKIGKITLPNNIIAAPIAGYSDVAFRRLCLEFGAGLVPTEMVSAKGLVYRNKGSYPLLQKSSNESPSCVQLFGSEKEFFAKAIDELKRLDYHFDIIDVNMGCPMPKITKNGEGSALMKDVLNACSIVETLKKYHDTVTCKIRIGWDENNINAVSFAKSLENAGADLVTVHGRTRKQLYSGKANWDVIGEVKTALTIPVFGNGDVLNFDEAQERMKAYGIDGVMIGRGAIGTIRVFCEKIADNVNFTVKDIILKHIKYLEEYFDEKYTINSMKKHLAYYLKGIENTRELRQKINKIETVNELKQEIKKGLL